MEDDFVVFASPPSVIASLLYSDKLGVTQERFCNSVVATTLSLLIYLSSLPKKKNTTSVPKH